MKEIKQKYKLEEQEGILLRDRYEEERGEIGEARIEIQKELESLNRKRIEINDSYLTSRSQVEEEKKVLATELE